MKKQITIFYDCKSEDPAYVVALEVNGINHYSADVRVGFVDTVVVTSRTTIEDKLFNAKSMQQLVDAGFYTKKELEIDVEEQKEVVFTKYYFSTKILKQ